MSRKGIAFGRIAKNKATAKARDDERRLKAQREREEQRRREQQIQSYIFASRRQERSTIPN